MVGPSILLDARMLPISLVADLPMSVLSIYYLTKSIDECITSADAHRIPSNKMVVCGLTAGPATAVNVLSAVTSAAMLMYTQYPSLCVRPSLCCTEDKLGHPSAATGIKLR